MPDRLSRINILAAAELYRRGEIDKICITVKPELSEAQVKRLKALLSGAPQEAVLVKPQTVTTREEITTFRGLARENGWESLVTIGNPAHLPRIRKEIEKAFRDKRTKIEAKSSSEVLSHYPRYAPLLHEMENWPEQLSLNFQEKILRTPVLGRLILSLSRPFAQTKIALQTLAFNIFERKVKI